jgi:hypothetical protein
MDTPVHTGMRLYLTSPAKIPDSISGNEHSDQLGTAAFESFRGLSFAQFQQ